MARRGWVTPGSMDSSDASESQFILDDGKLLHKLRRGRCCFLVLVSEWKPLWSRLPTLHCARKARLELFAHVDILGKHHAVQRPEATANFSLAIV